MNSEPGPHRVLRERRPGPATSMWLNWPPLRILALAVMLMAGNFLLQVIFYSLGGGLFMPVLVGAVGGVVAPLALVGRSAQLPVAADFSLHRPAPAVLAVSGLMAIAALSPTSLLAQWSLRLHPPDPQWLGFMAESMPSGPIETAVAIVAVVFAAPLAEELVFRGLLHRLASYLWGTWPAVAVSSLVFGIVHGEPWYLFGLIGVGIVLAVVYEATGSVVACWVTHAIHNAVSLGMMMWGEDTAGEATPLTLVDWAIAAGSLVLVFLLGTYLWRGRKRRAR